MKNIFIIVLALTALAMFSISCDKVEFPYEEDHGGGEPVSDTIRKMLMEDYTGHQCVNCPEAALILEDLHHLYGDRLVTVAIHTGFFSNSFSSPYEADYKSADGEVISAFFGGNTAGLPKGIANRAKVNGNHLIERTEFGTEVSKVLDDMDTWPDIYIEVMPTYNSANNTFDVEVKLTAMKDMPAGKYNLSVLITEDSIISAQKNINPNINGGQEILNYTHMHMLRGAVNTPWGEEFTTSISKDEIFTKPYTGVTIDGTWNVDNLNIVAFAYYADGPREKEVIQAQTEKLK